MPEPELGLLGAHGGLLREAMNGLTDHAFVVLDGSYCVTFWSRGAETMFGRSAVNTLGVHLDRVFADENPCWQQSDLEDASAMEVRVNRGCWHALPDGSPRYLVTTATELRENSRCIGFALHAHDPTDGDAPSETSSEAEATATKRVSELSQQVREMAAQLETERAERATVDWSRFRQLRRIVARHEDERGRIAHDLRERLGQQLTALQLTVEALAIGGAVQPPVVDEIQKSLEMIAEIGRGLDSVAGELRPAALDDLGLRTVLRNYVHQWSRHTGIRGAFHSRSPDSERFSPEVEATLYQITRTALEMLAQAGASSVDVLLERDHADALLVVEDDAVAPSESRHAMGLARMREGAAALGGTVELEPTPAGGTAVLARVPLLTNSSFNPVAAEGQPVGAPNYAAPTVDGPAAEPSEATNLLRARVAELRSAVAARDEFVATVAHELRNPVAPLVFQIRLAIEKTEQMARADERVSPDWVQSEFRRVEQRLHRLLETLDRLLDVSRMSTGRVDLQPEPVNLVRTVREVVGSFEAELGVAQCSLTLEERCAPTGSWDRIRLEQICRNLLSNAIRFGAGSPIEVSIDGDSDFAILQVRDHGVGIAPDQQSRMFERFERGAEQRSGGFGIGLWVVKNICAAMGGTISVESRLGEGACFTVMLPRHANDSANHAHSNGFHHGT